MLNYDQLKKILKKLLWRYDEAILLRTNFGGPLKSSNLSYK